MLAHTNVSTLIYWNLYGVGRRLNVYLNTCQPPHLYGSLNLDCNLYTYYYYDFIKNMLFIQSRHCVNKKKLAIQWWIIYSCSDYIITFRRDFQFKHNLHVWKNKKWWANSYNNLWNLMHPNTVLMWRWFLISIVFRSYFDVLIFPLHIYINKKYNTLLYSSPFV